MAEHCHVDGQSGDGTSRGSCEETQLCFPDGKCGTYYILHILISVLFNLYNLNNPCEFLLFPSTIYA